jgi:hypothetical protein
MPLKEAYLWLDCFPDIGSIENLGLRKCVVESYTLFSSEASGLLKVKTSLLNLVKFKELNGLLGESVVSKSYRGQSTEDVKCFTRITDIDGCADAVMQALSRQDYVRKVSYILGYGGDNVIAELTYMTGKPYQRPILEKAIGTITENFRIVPSLVGRKVI